MGLEEASTQGTATTCWPCQTRSLTPWRPSMASSSVAPMCRQGAKSLRATSESPCKSLCPQYVSSSVQGWPHRCSFLMYSMSFMNVIAGVALSVHQMKRCAATGCRSESGMFVFILPSCRGTVYMPVSHNHTTWSSTLRPSLFCAILEWDSMMLYVLQACSQIINTLC